MTIEQLFRSYVEAWNTQDSAKLMTLFTSDATYWDASRNGIASRMFSDMWSQMSSRFSDLRMEITTITGEKDRGTFEWTMRGTEKSGDRRQWQWSGADIVEFRDGKMRAIRSYWDQSQLRLMEQREMTMR